MTGLWKLLLCYHLFFWISDAYANKTLILREETILGVPVAPYMQFFMDHDNSWNIDTIIRDQDTLPWLENTDPSPDFSYFKGAIWARLSLDDQRLNRHAPIFFEHDYPPIDHISFWFFVDGRLQEMQAGDNLSRDKWAFDSRLLTSPLTSASEKKQTLYFKISSSSSLQMPVTLWTNDAYHVHAKEEEALQCLYFGALLVLAIYNFLIYVVSRLRFYLAYVVFLSFYGIFQAALGGQWSYYIARDWPGSGDFALPFGYLIAAMGCTVLTLSIFDLKLTSKQKIIWKKTGLIVFILPCLSLMSVIFIPFSTFMKTGMLTVLSALLYALITAFIALRQGERMGQWFVLAWFMLVLGSIINVFRTYGWIPSIPLTIYAQQIGSALEFTLISFALADRIKILQDQVHQNLKIQRELAHEKEAIEKALRLETELRLSMTSTIAHRLNNPLNYIRLGIDGIRIGVQKIRSSFEALLDDESSSDPEMIRIQSDFRAMFDELKDPIENIEDGLKKSNLSINEIRALSGIDGWSIERVSIKDVLISSRDRLKELLTPQDFARLDWITLSDSRAFQANFYVIKSAVEFFILMCCKNSKKILKISLEDRSNNTSIKVEGRLEVDEVLRRALLSRLSQILSPCQLTPSMDGTEDHLILSFNVGN